MSAPLGKGEGASGGGRRPTEHQLQMARVRARATGESVAHVLSVFMGGGRSGLEAVAGATGPEAPLTDDPAGGPGGSGGGAGTEPMARVIPLWSASRSAESAESANSAESAEPVDTAADETDPRPPEQEG
jgi:hypothetical protein